MTWTTEKQREYNAKYYKENRERILEQNAQWRAANKETVAEYNREYAKANRDQIAERIRPVLHATYKRNKDHVNAIKTANPCTDCGQRYPAVAMDFDHVRGEKDRDVAKLVGARCSLDRIDAEIAKCELVCANCHRIRTHERLVRG